MKIFLSLFVFFFYASFAGAQQDIPHNAQPFAQWLKEFRADATAQGIRQQTLDIALADIAPIARIIELDRKQPEGRLTLEEYLEKTISTTRITEGREAFAEHQLLLSKVESKYAVPAQVIVALWGIETSYGNNTGGFDIVAALATLAYDGRRSAYFRGELINALWILDAEHISKDDFQGSWAGAMGQCQFMPTSFLKYAVDFDGDGKRDIWYTNADVFASIANYLHSEGWDYHGEIIEGSNNFKVLLKWNRSRYFATAVGQLAHAIKE